MDKIYSVIAVDDSPEICLLVGKMLPESRFRVFTAGSIEAAQNLLSSHLPDILLLDRDLGGKDGLQFLRMLKSNPVYENVPIMMITANNSRESVGECMRAGAADYIVKPFLQRTLIDRLARALERAARQKIVGKGGPIDVQRMAQRTVLEFPGGIGAQTAAEFSRMMEGALGTMARQDNFVFDLRTQPELTAQQAASVHQMMKAADMMRSYVLAGRSYVQLLAADIAEDKLFLSESDLDEFLQNRS